VGVLPSIERQFCLPIFLPQFIGKGDALSGDWSLISCLSSVNHQLCWESLRPRLFECSVKLNLTPGKWEVHHINNHCYLCE